jgi:phospholipase/carboxylesterase
MTVDAYLAATEQGDAASPLVFAFHGTGGSETQLLGLAGQLVPGAAIVAPRGDVSEHGAARFFRRLGEGRYDMEDLARRTARMAGFIAAHKAAHPGRQVFGFGYSNGANILAAAVMARPDLFDRVALLHPLIPWEPEAVPALAGKPVLITAGQNDPICPWPLSARLIDWAEAQGARVATEIHPGGHEIRQAEIEALARFFATARHGKEGSP